MGTATNHDDADFISEIDAAKELHRHPQTLRVWRRDGSVRLKYLRIGGRYYYRKTEIQRFLQSCEGPEKASA
jgi:hypothetical protein